MTPPATPAQLAANNMAATEMVDVPADAVAGPSTASLRALVAATETSLHHIDPDGVDAGAIGLLADWHDALTALKSDVSAILHARGEDLAIGPGFLESLRELMGGHGLKALVSEGTRMIDMLHDVIESLADPDAISALTRHRATFVSLVNRAQDRLDT